jgi:NAD(P)H dehydrogenase (quinone)
MHTLIISSHPHTDKPSFTKRLTDKLVSQVTKNKSVKVMDLFDSKWQQPYYDFSLEQDEKFLETRKKIQYEISLADQLIFIHPLWWGGQPAVLKNWIDANITSGFAFKYSKKPQWQSRLWPLPKGLLKGKTSKVFITGDGQLWVYLLLLFPFFNIYLFFIFIYCGVRPKSFRYFGGMKWRSQKNLESILDSVSL